MSTVAEFHVPNSLRRTFSVWKRNARVWKKLAWGSVLFNVGEPLVYLLGFGFGLGYFIGDFDGVPYLTFLASGILASNAMTVASFEAMYSVYTRMVPQKTYDGLMATPIKVSDIMMGELLWCATKSVFSGCFIIAAGLALGALSGWTLVLVPPALFLTGMAFAAIALVVTAKSPSYEFFSFYNTLILTPMIILCGVFFPLSRFPQWLQNISEFLPLTHAVALIRPLATGTMPDQIWFHASVLLATTIVASFVAIILVRRRLIV